MFERRFRIKHNRSVELSPENHPMPESLIPSTVPFYGEEGKRREGVPGSDGLFLRGCINLEMFQKRSDEGGVGPEAGIGNLNA
jgi:hypothetical protein